MKTTTTPKIAVLDTPAASSRPADVYAQYERQDIAKLATSLQNFVYDFASETDGNTVMRMLLTVRELESIVRDWPSDFDCAQTD